MRIKVANLVKQLRVPGQLKSSSALPLINCTLLVIEVIYLQLRYKYITTEIPIWYTREWGAEQLGSKDNLYLIIAVSASILVGGAIISKMAKTHYFRYGEGLLRLFITFCNSILAYSFFRIISISAYFSTSLINPYYVGLILPFVTALIISFLFAGRFIEFAHSRGIITDPATHTHPGMILRQPSARGGGVVFTVAVVLATLVFVQVTKQTMGILVCTILLAILGYADDLQNTDVAPKLKLLEQPLLRLGLLVAIVWLLIPFGIRVSFVSNPFDGIYQLIQPLSIAFTIIWLVWVLNLLSWSNGIDGQYSGIVGIAALVVAVLALRFMPVKPEFVEYAKLATIIAGASFGLIPYMWHPSKMMWGFGATAAGLGIAAISILINSKVTTSILILLIPFMDATVTLIRRILQGKNPFRGDRGHFHHLLLDRGWPPHKIALFYWITTAVFGIVGILSADKLTYQTAFTAIGLVAFILVAVNLKLALNKQRSPKAE